jgi:hypothetical protein
MFRKIPIIVTIIIISALAFLAGAICYWQYNTATTEKITNTIPGVFVDIEPYTIDNAGNAVFSIKALSKESDVAEVTYWTDKLGACKAKTEPFTKLISVPLGDIDNYVFFELTDKNGNISEIYAMSPNPIHQCGNLAE